ncbi:MAG: caspase family protein [Burkholderiales bacterium]|nr:caspase family protein [Burkholderiales bacterium]
MKTACSRVGAWALAICAWNAFAGPEQPTEAPILRTSIGAHSAPIRAIDVDSKGRYAVTAAEDKTAGVWDLESGRLLQILRPPLGPGNDGKLFAAAITPDGNMVAVGGWSADNDVYVFDRTSGALRHRITGLPDVVTQLAFSPDGRTLAVGLWSANGVRLFGSDSAWRNSREIGSDNRYEGAVSGARFSGDGTRLAVASTDGLVRIYDVSQRSLKLASSTRPTQGRQPFGVAWSADGTLVAVGFSDSTSIAVLKADTLQLAYAPSAAGAVGGGLSAVAWTRDGRDLLAAGTWRRSDRLNGLRRWRERGTGAISDESIASNSIVGLHALSDGRVVYASTEPSWGWLDSTALGSTRHAFDSALADFRNARNTFRLSPDGAAIAFPLHGNGGSGDVVGFDVVQLQWTPPQPQWKPPSAGKAPLLIGDWFESAVPTLNQRRIPLNETELSMSAAVAPSNAGVALGTSQHVRYYNANGGELWRVAAPGTTWQVTVSENGRWVVAAFSDGTIHWYAAKDGAEHLILFAHTDRRRWVLWSPSGYFAAGPGSEDLIGWHLNRGKDLAADFFPASRFRSQFYRPDVVARVIETADIQQAIRLADADANRKPRTESATVALPPVVEILAPLGDISTAKSEVTLRLALRTPIDAPVVSVRVRVNGLLQPELRFPKGASASSVSERELTVRVPPENAEIHVFAENRNGISTPAIVPVKWSGAKPSEPASVNTATPDNLLAPKLYVLAVGMSKYRNASYNLDFAAKDASDFSRAMSLQKGALYRDVVVRVLTDGKATKDDVLDGLEWLKREVTSRDVGILFLAGHGINDNAGNYYFLPHDGNPEQLLRTGVAQNDIKLALNSIAGKALFFIDSCHSGNALGTAKTRGVVDVNAVVNELASAENGVIVFAASTGRQFSIEAPEWGNGAFTKAVVEGLSGKADFRKTGVISHKALDFYVAERVKELTKGQQSPVSITPSGIGDFPIALVKR